MKLIITGDETWVYDYNMETSQSRSKIKVLLIVFFNYHGVVHSEFLPDGQMVIKNII